MSDERIKAAAVATFTQYLSQHHLRRTPERFAILDKVFESASHFSIDALHATLDQSGYHVSRATVYNTIELLGRCGLVRRHSFAAQSPQYEKVVGLTRHYHLVCSRCGKVREIKDSEIDLILTTRRFGKFQPQYIDLNVYGLCSSCARKSRPRIAATKAEADNKNSKIKNKQQ